MKTAIIVPTLNAGDDWVDWVQAVSANNFPANDVFVVDSGSTDHTLDISRASGYNIIKLGELKFDHGGTRNMAIESIDGYEFVVFLTQDAILADSSAIAHILKPFDDGKVSAVCGRQLPRPTASAIEAHARLFNYPAYSREVSSENASIHGLKSVFLSNSFSAYRLSDYKSVGGFPSNIVFGEDMYIAAKFLKAGFKVVYSAESCVYHSHKYNYLQELRRYFDMGVFHSQNEWIRDEFGVAERQGMNFIRSEFKYLLGHEPLKLPESMMRNFLKYIGFRLGLKWRALPPYLIQYVAMNKGYFN